MNETGEMNITSVASPQAGEIGLTNSIALSNQPEAAATLTGHDPLAPKSAEKEQTAPAASLGLASSELPETDNHPDKPSDANPAKETNDTEDDIAAKKADEVLEELAELKEETENAQDEAKEFGSANESAELIDPLVGENAEGEPNMAIVVDTTTQLKRAVALMFRIIMLAVFSNKLTFTKKDMQLAGDPANSDEGKLSKRLGKENSWETVKKGVDTIQGELPFGEFISTVLAINEKAVPYKIKLDKQEKPAGKPLKQPGKAFAFVKRGRGRA